MKIMKYIVFIIFAIIYIFYGNVDFLGTNRFDVIMINTVLLGFVFTIDAVNNSLINNRDLDSLRENNIIKISNNMMTYPIIFSLISISISMMNVMFDSKDLQYLMIFSKYSIFPKLEILFLVLSIITFIDRYTEIKLGQKAEAKYKLKKDKETLKIN